MPMHELTLIIPAKNEAESLPAVLSELKKYNYKIDIVLHSTDIETIQAIKECEVTLRMNPNHFGAWHGKGLCLYKLASYSEAIESFRSALKIQPYADINRVYIATCMGNLN